MTYHIFCDSTDHPILDFLKERVKQAGQSLKLLNHSDKISSGDILFLVSCNQILSNDILSKYQHVLVLHASDLPMGRGWNPHVWQILSGKREIVVSLLQANEKVDTGDIWIQETINILPTDIFSEINEKVFEAEYKLIMKAIEGYQTITPTPQTGESTYYRKRTPEDSEINIHSSIESQFDLLRVCDPVRYPAFFYVDGTKYILKLEKY